nr:putative ribonuclease H-like domain-containing protein [Tanacetum cinerariifolium]
MQQYLQHKHYALWEVIEFVDSYEAPANDPSTTTTNTTSGEAATKSGRTVTLTTEDMQKKKNDATILKTFGGNEATKKTKKNLLKQQYGNFRAEGSETLEQTFTRLQVIVGQLQFMDVEVKQDNLNQNFLTSLAPEWLMHTIVWRNRSDLDTMSLDDLYNHLKVYETEVQKKMEPNTQNMAFISSAKHSRGNDKVNTASVYTASINVSTASANIATASISQETTCSYIASQSSRSQIKFEDINQIDEDDMEEMDIKWNMALLSLRADKFWKKTRKNISIQGSDVAGFDKLKVECFNCHKMGHFTRECRAPRNQDRGRRDNYRQGTESKVFDNSLCSKDCKKNNDSLNSKITDLTDKLFDAKNMIYHCLLIASKDLDNLIESQRSDKSKEGLGYIVVPPPPAQLYLSFKKDLSWTGLSECVDDTVTDYSRPSPTVKSSSEEDQNKNPFVSKNVASPITPKPFISPDFVMKKKACFNCGDFNHLAYECRKRVKRGTTRPFQRKSAVISQYRAPWIPTVNQNFPHVNRKFSTGSRNFPTVNRKFSTANRKFPTGSTKNLTADMGMKGKAIKSSACWTWKPSHNLSNKECIVLGRDFKLLDDANIFLRTPRQHNMYPIDLNNIVPHRDLICLVAKAFANECRIWHRRLASRKFPTGSTKYPTADIGMKGKADSGYSRHMTGNISYLSDYEPFDGGYVSFGQGGCKITRKETIKTGKLEFENVYFVKDLKYNLFSVSQICDNKNSVLYTDSECIVLRRDFKLLDDANILLRTPRQHNMYSIDLNNIVLHRDLTCLVAKASADECIIWHRRLENLKDLKVKIIRCDNGGEFRNKELNDFCSQKGIKNEFSNARTPQQNGVAERRNRSLIEAARTMVLVNKIHNKTPYELFNDRTPAIGFLKPFGCHVMILNTLDNLGPKVDARQDVKKDVASLRFIVLPNWVHKEHLESTSSQPQDACNTDAPKSSGNSNLTATLTNPSADQLETLIVETPIPTVNILGVTLDEDESNGVEADVSNMETTITASPTPTLRIHRDHPKSQIMGPVDTPIQTRNKSKEAPRAWYGTLSKYLLTNGFQRGTIDQTLFIRRQRGNFILVHVYVDDIIFGSLNPHLCREFEALVHEKFQMSTMGELNFFLGLQVLQKEDGIFLSQDKYVGDILKKFGYSDVRSSNTPMDKENPWGKDVKRIF